ncbi:hypothetical protein EGW08_004785 [Elysia chlorotica]|uniref:Autophagy-related protein 27 n=1 Tax=Elysia chlorotica TaxID=188477 RepID=A0A433U0U8_ELYCH|nr:hypothetical protein EGW08_004785 [Elysia chlorotica]
MTVFIMASKHKFSISVSSTLSSCFIRFSILINLVNLSFSQITPAPLLCSVPGFDYFNLTAAVWSVNLNQSECVSQGNSSNAKACSMYFTFCRNLDWLPSCEGSSVCQVSNGTGYNLGASSTNPFIIDEISGLQAKFFNGDPYIPASGATCRLHTTVTFACNRKAKWTVDRSTRTVKQAPWLRYIKFNANTCQMDMSFLYAGACKYPVQEEGGIGPGTIVILVFGISFLIYLVVGSLINLSLGHSGVEILPHNSFWRMLPTYIKEGCIFTFCRSRRRSSSDYSAI